MKKLLLPLYILVASSGVVANAQVSYTTTLPESLFSKGKEMFEVKNWDGCIDLMTRYKQNTNDIDLIQEADFMIASSAFEKNKAYAASLLKKFCMDYPWSRHIDEANLLIGSHHFFNEEYAEAIDWLDEIDFERLPLSQQPLYFLRLGISYLKVGNTHQAKPLFKTLSLLNTEYKESADYYLAYLQYYDKAYDAALSAFKALPQRGEYEKTIPYYITQIQFIKGNYDAALKEALELLNKRPEAEQEAELYRIAGESYFHLGNQPKAVAYLKRYVATVSTPQRGSAYILGIAAYQSDDYTTAIKNLSVATSGNAAMSHSAYLYLGHCYLKVGDLQNARMAFETASRNNTDRAVKEAALYNYGLTIHEGSYSPFNESVEVFEQFLNEFPNSTYTERVNDLLVESYMNTRNYEVALTSINKISRPGQKILGAKQRIIFQLGTQAVVNADLNGAKQCFTEAIALGAVNAEIRAQSYFWRGECEYRQDNYKKAESDYRQYISLSNDRSSETYSLSRYNLAYTYFKQHQFDHAIKWFGDYLALPSERGKNTYADALNRIGDSHFYKRQFAKAEEYYAQAASLSPTAGDYALFQRGFMAGLQKNYSAKIQSLDKLLSSYPKSEYAPEALFEMGKTYVTLNNTQKAIESFNKLTVQYPNSAVARQAGVNLGLIHFNNNRLDQAIASYKEVINKYPGSQEARTAAEDLKAVYIEKNDIPAYASYIQSLKGKVQFAASEQDSLTYLATERVLMRRNNPESVKALSSYLSQFEDGAFRLNANTELARIYFADKNYSKAITYYEAILMTPDNSFTEEAWARTAEIYYTQGNMEKALDHFTMLERIAEQKENKLAAKLGVLRTSRTLGKQSEVIVAAGNLLDGTSVLAPELRSEALYDRATAYLALNQESNATKDLQELSQDTRNRYGAEAKYRLAEIYFKKGDSNRAEKEVNELIESATPHQYWMARGFILLADIYIARGEMFQAKQYLQSLQNNYKGNDDIAGMIQDRFKKIGE